MMKKYFESKIGQTIQQSITTGDTFFTKVYKRVYSVEVLGIENNKLFVQVKSHDVVPSGYTKGGTSINRGETSVAITGKSQLDIIFNIIKNVDAKFVDEYKIKAIS